MGVAAVRLLLPGVVLAFVVSTLASGRVALWLGVRRAVAWVLLVSAGVILAATMSPLRGEHRLDFPVGRILRPVADRAPVLDQLGGRATSSATSSCSSRLGFAIALVPRSRRKAVLLAAAVALPFAIEATQLLVVDLDRACESADSVDNLTGLLIGLVAGAVVARLTADAGSALPNRAADRASRSPDRPIGVLAGCRSVGLRGRRDRARGDRHKACRAYSGSICAASTPARREVRGDRGEDACRPSPPPSRRRQ